jgi:hypothetical protein
VIDAVGRFTLAEVTGLSWAMASLWLRYTVAVMLVAQSEDDSVHVMLVAVLPVGLPMPTGAQVVIVGSVFTAGMAGEPNGVWVIRTHG